SISKIGFSPERGNRYRYSLEGFTPTTMEDRGTASAVPHTNDTGIEVDLFKFPDGITSATPIAFKCTNGTPGVVTGATGSFVGGAQGNIDNDSTTDQWTVYSSSHTNVGTCDADTNVAGGEPQNDLNDVNQ